MNNNRCVCCGKIIPEGRQVCPDCVEKISKTQNKSGGDKNEQSSK